MARAKKKQIDYFNLSVNFLDELQTRKLIKHYGGDGILVFTKLITETFKNGFYLPIDSDAIEFYADDIRIKPDRFVEIMKALVDMNFFDREKFDRYLVLTSQEIQENYFSVKKKNKSDIKLSQFEEQLLIDSDEENDSELIRNNSDEFRRKFRRTPTEMNDKKSENRRTEKKDVKAAQNNSDGKERITETIPPNSVPKEKRKKRKEKEREREKKEKEIPSENPTENSLSLPKEFLEIIFLFPENLRPKSDDETEQWKQNFDELRKKLSLEQIKRIILYGLSDNFWQTKLLSLPYLNHKSKTDGVAIWQKLNAEANRSKKGQNFAENPKPVDTNINYI